LFSSSRIESHTSKQPKPGQSALQRLVLISYFGGAHVRVQPAGNKACPKQTASQFCHTTMRKDKFAVRLRPDDKQTRTNLITCSGTEDVLFATFSQ